MGAGVVALAGACCPDGRLAAGPATQPCRPTEDLPNFAKVSEGLYRGGQPTAKGFAQLKHIGIRTIVTLRALRPKRRRVEGHDFRYLHLAVKHFHPESEDVIDFLHVVTDPQNQPVFIHCRSGEDRTGMMVAVYRIVVQGWSKADALAEMKRMGFNEVFDPLEDYVEDLRVERLRRRLRRTPPPEVKVIP